MILVIARCWNEEKNIPRFLRCYDWADKILISDGGSVDRSVELLTANPKVELRHFTETEFVNGETWNPDNPHINFIINEAKKLDPDWIVMDDMDDVPNKILQDNARGIFETTNKPQINAFRLYLWGDEGFFPHMNRNFDPAYASRWAWNPRKIHIYADETMRHGTILGATSNYEFVDVPNCLLHRTWIPETVQAKVDRYNRLNLPTGHPFEFAGEVVPLPEWARDE